MFCSRLQDTFFYSLVYDPTQKTLLADKGEIRVGPRFQADVPEMLQEGQSKLHGVCVCVGGVGVWGCVSGEGGGVSVREGLVMFFSLSLRHFVLLNV